MKKQAWSIAVLIASLFSVAGASTESTIEINGESARVYFNDGDTFRILSGKLVGKRSRLEGFNTLESYGPVHRWGDFTSAELLQNAKEATENARRGGWHCVTDLSTDSYGRILSKCEDLAVDQLEKGLAHVMTLNEVPGAEVLVKAQQKSIFEKRGMWAKGVPEFIITSVHSVDEKPGQKTTYNRLVSTLDGHSELELHSYLYPDCEEVCSIPTLESSSEFVNSCMLYVNYKNRFGGRMAQCLKN